MAIDNAGCLCGEEFLVLRVERSTWPKNCRFELLQFSIFWDNRIGGLDCLTKNE